VLYRAGKLPQSSTGHHLFRMIVKSWDDRVDAEDRSRYVGDQASLPFYGTGNSP